MLAGILLNSKRQPPRPRVVRTSGHNPLIAAVTSQLSVSISTTSIDVEASVVSLLVEEP